MICSLIIVTLFGSTRGGGSSNIAFTVGLRNIESHQQVHVGMVFVLVSECSGHPSNEHPFGTTSCVVLYISITMYLFFSFGYLM